MGKGGQKVEITSILNTPVQSLDFVTPYWANVSFFDPLKISENLELFWYMPESKKETLGQYRLIAVYKKIC